MPSPTEQRSRVTRVASEGIHHLLAVGVTPDRTAEVYAAMAVTLVLAHAGREAAQGLLNQYQYPYGLSVGHQRLYNVCRRASAGAVPGHYPRSCHCVAAAARHTAARQQHDPAQLAVLSSLYAYLGECYTVLHKPVLEIKRSRSMNRDGVAGARRSSGTDAPGCIMGCAVRNSAR